MAYSAWSVIAGEQPTASKWNLLGTNDASFNDGTGIGAGAIGTSALATSAVTTPKFKPTLVNPTLTAQGARFTTTSTSFVDVTGMSFTYTAGTTNEMLFIFTEAMGSGYSGGSMGVALNVNGSDSVQNTYYDTTMYQRQPLNGFFSVAANATITIKFRAKSSGGGTVNFVNDSTIWVPRIIGISLSNV